MISESYRMWKIYLSEVENWIWIFICWEQLTQSWSGLVLITMSQSWKSMRDQCDRRMKQMLRRINVEAGGRVHPCLEQSASQWMSDDEWDQNSGHFDSRTWLLMMVVINLNGSFLRNGSFQVLFLHFLNVTWLLPFIWTYMYTSNITKHSLIAG